jgi:hypothetical protein
VNERRTADDTLIRIVAVDDPVHCAKHRIAIANEVGPPGGQLLHRRLDLLHTRERLGMGFEPVGNASTLT